MNWAKPIVVLILIAAFIFAIELTLDWHERNECFLWEGTEVKHQWQIDQCKHHFGDAFAKTLILK